MPIDWTLGRRLVDASSLWGLRHLCRRLYVTELLLGFVDYRFPSCSLPCFRVGINLSIIDLPLA